MSKVRALVHYQRNGITTRIVELDNEREFYSAQANAAEAYMEANRWGWHTDDWEVVLGVGCWEVISKKNQIGMKIGEVQFL